MRPLTDFLQFSRTERNGAILLAAFCLLSAAAPILLRLCYRPPKPDFSAFDALVRSYRESMAASSPVSLFEFDPNTVGESELIQLGLSPRVAAIVLKYRSRGGRFRRPEDLCKIHGISAEDCERLQPYVRIAQENRFAQERPRPKRVVAERFTFDPNTATQTDLLRLGIPEWVARNILRYREKGGRFRAKTDLSKIYGIPDELMESLEPLIVIPEQTKTAAPTTVAYKDKSAVTRSIPQVDINRDGPEAWDQLPGIGSTRARQIIAFRDKLGGFGSVEQIAETRGLPDSVFQAIRPYLTSSPILNKIALNTISREALAGHPYVSFKQADLLVAYRTQHGPFSSVEDILKIPPLKDPEWLARIRPYLSLE